MTNKKDYSYGVIPVYRKDNGDWEVFLLNQISLRRDIYWTFPKGHPDEGESEIETAIRELDEEAGLQAELHTDTTFDQNYSFNHEGVLVDKRVSYYVGLVSDKSFKLQPEEVKEAKWCSFAEAYKSLTHDQSKNTLKEVEEYLKQLDN